jgi:hypothetical protein
MVSRVKAPFDAMFAVVLAIRAGETELLAVHLSAKVVDALTTDHPATMQRHSADKLVMLCLPAITEEAILLADHEDAADPFG